VPVIKEEENFNDKVLWYGTDVLNQIMDIITVIHSQRFILVINST
jgi:hypothetical protein